MTDLITQIGTILTSALGWIATIIGDLVEIPFVLFLIGFGLAGVMFRWAKSLVHFH